MTFPDARVIFANFPALPDVGREARRRAATPLACVLPAALACALCSSPALASAAGAVDSAWWLWPLALFAVCVLLGIVAVPAGVGGGVLFVPIVSSFFPFHLDYVRGAGLLVALASALAAGPRLMRGGLASLRLALPLAVVASIGSLIGAIVGLAMPASLMQVSLGLVIIGVVVLMIVMRNSELPVVGHVAASRWPRVSGLYYDHARGAEVRWHVHRFGYGMAAFAVNGLLGGMFGVGAGWANVPALNLIMGAPLKIAVGTSSAILAVASSSAIFTYLSAGAILPLIAAPAVVGMMLGARVGARLLHVLHGTVIRRLVIAILLFAGVRSLLRGLGVWN